MAVIDYLKDRRILSLILLLAVLAVLDFHFGIHFGIEFAGGTQIPVTFEHPLNPNQTSQVISILQQRLSTFGLKQVTIEGVGDTEVLVEIPSVSQSDIQSTINLIQSQGVFEGIVNGKTALTGSSILSGSVGAAQPTISGDNVSWQVNFYITQQAAIQFSKVVFGQANQPLYMYLDRPTSAIVLLNSSLLGSGISASQSQEITSLEGSVALGNQTIPIELANPGYSNWDVLGKFFVANAGKYKEVILQNTTPQYIISNLTALNYTIVKYNAQNMTPSFQPVSTPVAGSTEVLDSWPAVGLLSAPILSPGVTNGSTSQGYVINGVAPSTLALTQRVSYADQQTKLIESVLSGGALPVHVIVGQPTVTPPTLGATFERTSAIALILAVIAVSVVIAIRYRKLFLIAPILLTTLAELFIILSIIGLIGTIDLSAIAGMIAVIGTGVDAQIIISDEVLHGSSESSMKIKLSNAFYIVWADAGLLVIAMLPLFFSTSLVSVIGFSESTIIGAMLGAFVTRPSYGAIITRHYVGKENA